MASFFFASDSSRSRRLRSSRSAATRAGISSTGTRNSDAAALASLRQIVGVGARGLRRSAPRCGARRRRRRLRRPRRSGRCRRCAAHACRRTVRPTSPACCRRPRPWRPRAPRRRISRRTARARRRRWRRRGHQPRDHRRILQHDVVGDVLDALDLVGAHRLGMREIEAQPIGRDQRALLRHVIAEHLAQRLVQQMRRRMILPDGAAPRVIDLQIERGRRP